jgi:hypothetical protein
MTNPRFNRTHFKVLDILLTEQIELVISIPDSTNKYQAVCNNRVWLLKGKMPFIFIRLCSYTSHRQQTHSKLVKPITVNRHY